MIAMIYDLMHVHNSGHGASTLLACISESLFSIFARDSQVFITPLNHEDVCLGIHAFLNPCFQYSVEILRFLWHLWITNIFVLRLHFWISVFNIRSKIWFFCFSSEQLQCTAIFLFFFVALLNNCFQNVLDRILLLWQPWFTAVHCCQC